jgi:hypothetical protein
MYLSAETGGAVEYLHTKYISAIPSFPATCTMVLHQDSSLYYSPIC